MKVKNSVTLELREWDVARVLGPFQELPAAHGTLLTVCRSNDGERTPPSLEHSFRWFSSISYGPEGWTHESFCLLPVVLMNSSHYFLLSSRIVLLILVVEITLPHLSRTVLSPAKAISSPTVCWGNHGRGKAERIDMTAGKAVSFSAAAWQGVGAPMRWAMSLWLAAGGLLWWLRHVHFSRSMLQGQCSDVF